MQLDELTIKQIDYKTAMQIVIEKHYLHRKCPCTFAFGLFDNHAIVGVIVYGTPSSSPLRKGVCGPDEQLNVIELTRLWVCDSVPKNGESYLIGNTLKLVNKEIIVSYAEMAEGHIGVVYQATNWIYTGLSAKRTNWTVEGMDSHCHTISDKYKTVKQIKEIFGDKFSLVERGRKHRYIYFNASRTRKKQLLRLLRYQIEPYPKTTV